MNDPEASTAATQYGSLPITETTYLTGAFVETRRVSNRKRILFGLTAISAFLVVVVYLLAPSASPHAISNVDTSDFHKKPLETEAPEAPEGAVELCLQTYCNMAVGNLMANSADPTVRDISSCLEDSGDDKHAGEKCLPPPDPALPYHKEKMDLRVCAMCHGCVSGKIEGPRCDASPSSYGAAYGAPGGGGASKPAKTFCWTIWWCPTSAPVAPTPAPTAWPTPAPTEAPTPEPTPAPVPIDDEVKAPEEEPEATEEPEEPEEETPAPVFPEE